MSVTVNWKGKIGYGDIISPICYAHNEAEKRKESVNLDFYFEHEPGTKFKDEDPETINDRVNYIVSNTEGNATVNQHYNTKLDYNHTNYDDSNLSLHNMRFAKETWTGEQDYIAVITSNTNKKQFSEYAPGKEWKDPLSGNWDKYLDKLSKHHNVVTIGYTTPIKNAASVIKTAKLVIGYHGSLMWLARWLAAPMVIISDNQSFSQKVFPWCIHSFNELYFDVSAIQYLSLKKLEETKRELNEYLHRV